MSNEPEPEAEVIEDQALIHDLAAIRAREHEGARYAAYRCTDPVCFTIDYVRELEHEAESAPLTVCTTCRRGLGEPLEQQRQTSAGMYRLPKAESDALQKAQIAPGTRVPPAEYLAQESQAQGHAGQPRLGPKPVPPRKH